MKPTTENEKKTEKLKFMEKLANRIVNVQKSRDNFKITVWFYRIYADMGKHIMWSVVLHITNGPLIHVKFILDSYLFFF